MIPFRFNLTFALLTSLASLLILTWLMVSLISFKTAEKDLLLQKKREVRLLMSAFAAVVTEPVSSAAATPVMTRLAAKIEQEKDFADLLVVDATGRPVFNRGDRSGIDGQLQELLRSGGETTQINTRERLVSRYISIPGKAGIAGAARLSLSLNEDYIRLKQSQRLLLAYFVLDFLLLLVLGAFLLRRSVVQPMRKLLASTERIASGDYSHTVHVAGSAEIADLADSFNKMLFALQQNRTEVESHVKSLEQVNIDLRAAREETIRSEKLASVGLLAAGMAHEIGTPLSAIIGYAGILRDELHNDPQKEDYLRRIEQEGERINRIVRELLNYARPTVAELEPLAIGELLAEMLEMLQRQGVFKKIATSLQVEPGLPLIVLDRHQMLQVLINLALNARDAMPDAGELAIKVTRDEFNRNSNAQPAVAEMVAMGRRRDDFGGAFQAQFVGTPPVSISCIRIDIADSGSGIPLEHLGRIFDPFFTTKEPGKGTGLGLSICARIIDSFGGRITVQSSPGQGSCFSIWLPVRKGEG